MRRTVALFALLLGVYATTIGLRAFGDAEYAGDEPRHLLAAESLLEDGDVDVRDEYAARAYLDFHPYTLEPRGQPTGGRLNEPHGVGFPLVILPAYAVGGASGVELFLAVLAALAIALAYRVALRVVPDPWALGAALAVGLSPPVLASATAVYPESSAGAALAGAALLALRLAERPSRAGALGCFALLGALPWLGARFVPAGVVVGYVAARTVWRARRRTLAVGAVELALFSLALYVGINEALYGGPTPYAAYLPGESATGASFPGDYPDRAYRLVALFIDRGYGLLRWAPVLALAGAGLWWLWRSRRERLAQAVPGLREIEMAAGLCAAVAGVQLFVAAFLAPTMFGLWFPSRHLAPALPLAVPLVAWGLRHAPRVGAALALLSLGASAWLWLDVRLGEGGLVADRPDAPLGPLTSLLPAFDDGRAWPFWFAGATGVVVCVLVLREAHRARRRLAPAQARR